MKITMLEMSTNCSMLGATATGKARSLAVERHDVGTTSIDADKPPGLTCVVGHRRRAQAIQAAEDEY